MAVVENRFVCDLSKPVQAQALKGNVFSLDNLGSRISVLIYNNGQPATISGSVTANCILPDGSTVNVNGGLTTENGGSKAYVDVPQSCLLIPGILKIAIKCTSSSVITTLAAIVANVYMTKTDNVITPSQQIITDWNAEISAAIATQNAAIANQDTKINDLKSAFANFVDGVNSDGNIIEEMYQGGYTSGTQNANLSSLAFTTASTTIRSTPTNNKKNIVLPANTDVFISVDDGYRYAYQVYDTTTEKGLDVFEWSTQAKTIRKTNSVYLIIMIGKTDQSNISPTEYNHLRVSFVKPNLAEIDDKVDFTKNQSLTDAQKEIARANIGITSGLVTFPFTFDIGVNVYKEKNRYITDFDPHSKVYHSGTGVVVFLSPNGDDTNDGLTIITPKKTFASALSVTNAETLILLEGTYVKGTHFTAGQQITVPLNIIGIGEVIIDNVGNNNPLRFYRTLYVENVHFKHGSNTVMSELSQSDRYAVFYKCVFSESDRNNGVSILGGTAYMVDCIAYGNAYDGFNYHKVAGSSGISNKAIEINCIAYGNGTYNLDGEDGQSSNGSTSHDNSSIVRVNGEYYACHGGVVADKECNSACYGSCAGISTVTDETNYPDRMSNYWCSYGHMWLYDCVSYGSKYDTAVVNGGTITTDTEYPSVYPET